MSSSNLLDDLMQFAANLDIVDDVQALLDDPFIGNTLAQNSNLPSQIGNVVHRDNVTTDVVTAYSEIIDASFSMNNADIINAVIEGSNGIQDVLATTSQRGEFHQYRNTYTTDRLGASKVHTIHTFVRLMLAKNNRTLNAPRLTANDYKPSQGNATPTVSGLQSAAADIALFEAACKADDVDAIFNPVMNLMTDGFMNSGPAAAAWRKFVMMPGRSEKWQRFGVAFATPYVVEGFASHLRRHPDEFAQFAEWYQSLSGEADEDRAFARLLFESMLTGWGFYVTDSSGIATIGNVADQLRATLYLFTEEYIISNLESSYNGHGGLAIPPQNVLTSWAEPEEIITVLKVKFSSSLVRASKVLGGQPIAAASPADDEDSVV